MSTKILLDSWVEQGMTPARLKPEGRFSKLPEITGPVKLFCFHFRCEFQKFSLKLLAKETKWTSLEVRTHPTFLATDFKI